MDEATTFGGWTAIGPHPAGAPDARLAASASGEEAVLRMTDVADEAAIETLMKAAETLAAVNHPNVARLFAWGVADVPAAPDPTVAPTQMTLEDGAAAPAEEAPAEETPPADDAPTPEDAPAGEDEPGAAEPPVSELDAIAADLDASQAEEPAADDEASLDDEHAASRPIAQLDDDDDDPDSWRGIAADGDLPDGPGAAKRGFLGIFGRRKKGEDDEATPEDAGGDAAKDDAEASAKDGASGAGEPATGDAAEAEATPSADASAAEPSPWAALLAETPAGESLAATPATTTDAPTETPVDATAVAASVPAATIVAGPMRTKRVFWTIEELVPGSTLQTIFAHAGGRLPVHDAARWGAQVCAGLSALHGHGIALGSMSPSSIMITPEGDARVTAVVPPRPAAPAATDPPDAAHFGSPELFAGTGVTPVSDLYSLGAILYRAVTGSFVFDAPTAAGVAELHGSAPPEALRRINPQVTASFESVVLRSLAKEPKGRYGSAEEMRQDLERVAAGGTIMGGPAAFAKAAEEPRKGMAWWKWVLIVLGVALALGLLGTWGYLFFTKPVVPDVSGLTETEAAAVLSDGGLVLGQVNYRAEVPSDATTGTVLGQDPPSGTRVSEGTVVDIVIAGAKTAPVPSLIGLTQADALLQIQQAGFRLGSIETTYGTTDDMGNVLSQTPTVGIEVPEGSPIIITVSTGPELVTVPGVVGRTEADGKQAMTDAGFTVEVVAEPSDTTTKGAIIRQSPDAGVTATKGTKVTLYVSSGKGKVAVPNVQGLTEAEAKTDLTNAGLKVVVQYRNGPQVGKVVDQSPTKGTQVDPDSTVYITVERAAP